MLRPSFTYSAPQPDWPPPVTPPPARQRNRKRTLRRLGTTLGVIVVLALVASVGVYVHRLGWEQSEYGYDIVERMTVSASDPWVIPLPFFTKIDDETPAVEIYSDPELTAPIPFANETDSFTITGKKGTFTPYRSEVDPGGNLPRSNTTFYLGSKNTWPAGVYYIAELKNFFGKELGRPRVHVYTVAAESFVSPSFTMEVANGSPSFQWTGVEGASSYYILKSTPSPTGDADLEVIGSTDSDATSWTAATQDMAYENARQNQKDVTSYNAGFQAVAGSHSADLCTPQDADYHGPTPPDWDDSGFLFPSYSVVALDADGDSTLPVPQDGRAVIVNTPVATATGTLGQMATDAGTDLFVPDTFPVTMGDCRTVFFPVAPQSLVAASDKSSITLRYAVTGTLLTHSLTGAGDSYSQVQGLGGQYNLRQLVQLGPMQDLNYMSDSQVVLYAMQQTPSGETPDSPYEWNGSSEMVKFIAANMFAGNTAIDLSRFTADPASPLIADAASEAFLQNPYITDFSPIVGIQDDVLYVSYETTPEDRAASAARVKAKVDEIVGSIITPDMGDRAKALAINKYLAQNAVYDQAAANFSDGRHNRSEYMEAYPNSWDAEGVLIEGTGVCSSYASAFKALADAVGLASVTVTGWADDSGIGHEWVKAQLDGSWWIIDPTWDSNVWEQVRGNVQMFFGLTDSQAGRTPFNGFVVDSHIADYDTP